MPFRQFEYFLEVVENASINQAAKRLFIEQQALRASINSLERKLGFSLLKRSKRGVTLTSEGEAILNDVRKIVDFGRSWRRFSKWDDRTPVTVRITATPSILNRMVIDFAHLCKKKHPNLTLIFYESKFHDLLSDLQYQGKIGIIGSLPEGLIEEFNFKTEMMGMVLEKFCKDSFQVLINAEHPLSGMPFIRLSDLKDLTPAMYPMEDQFFCYREIYKWFSTRPPYYLSRQENIFNMIAKDRSVAAVFPRVSLVSPYFPENLIKSVKVEDYPMPAYVALIYPDDVHISPAERIVANALRKELSRISL